MPSSVKLEVIVEVVVKVTFTGGCGGYVVGGWLDQVGIRLSQLSTKLKLKLSLAKLFTA